MPELKIEKFFEFEPALGLFQPREVLGEMQFFDGISP
jgi:hypothetical protein